MPKKKNVERPYYTPAERIRRVWDIEEIKDLMGRRGFYQANDMRREELTDLWVTQAQHQKTASMGSNWGYYVGMKDISYYYVVKRDEDRRKQLEQYTQTHPEVANTEDNLGYGCMVWHPVSTPMVILADDGKTAKGFWYVIGQESVATGAPLAECSWYMDRLAVDFVKEDGSWKIWHLVLANDLSSEAGEDYAKGEPYWDPETDPVAQEFGTPDVAVLTHDPNFNWWDDYPSMPEPYETFTDDISYGPEGFKPPRNKGFNVKEGRNYK